MMMLLLTNIVSAQEKDMSNLNCDTTKAWSAQTEELQNVDTIAEFPGGDYELIKFTSYNLNLPKNVNNRHGLYVVSIDIDTFGNVKNPCIVRPINPYPYGMAILEGVNEMPKWKPAIKNGQKVESRYLIPYRFCVGR